jgi:5'-nucleotidase
MCVLAARLGGFGEPPDVVVSGINAGLNTGRAVLHSGTIGAALTAQNFGMSAVAVSLQEGEPWQWDTAAELVIEVMGMVLEAPVRSVLNLNVPDRERSSVRGLRWARLAPFGEVRMALVSEEGEPDPTGATTRRLSAELRLAEVSFDPDTDTGLVRAGYAALTTLVGVAEAWPNDDELTERIESASISESLRPGAPLHATHRVPDADARGSLRRPSAQR